MDPDMLRAVLDSISKYEVEHRHLKTHGGNVTVCYPEVGCFEEVGYLVDMIPSPPQEVGTRFLMYSSRHSRRADTPLLDVDSTNISSAVYDWAEKAFNVSAPTKVIVHGFGSSCSHVWVYEMRSALMSVEDCNVVCVDWEKGAAMPNYPKAAANTRLVGRQLSHLLSRLNSRLGLDLAKVHLIGFSLGAHAVAFAGASLPNKFTINRITGLDPAGPLFELQPPKDRLDPSDARFVDVIHSNADAVYRGGLGSRDPMGHVDFYPNGGSMQSGCSNIIMGMFRDILSGGEAEGRSLCNHRRAYKFFTDSVSPQCRFPSAPCSSYEAFLQGECFPCTDPDTCPSMGYYADSTKARGALYLVTRQEEPFCGKSLFSRAINYISNHKFDYFQCTDKRPSVYDLQ
ncbi:hypothetical protein AAG570_004907 [Ranatra chinensis]|uniref:Lipase domain-containing protein n=1 Tax=Ranatra chinensis TaxID=642074 RepID=A0ABD0YBM9_9HEMI